MKAKLLYALKWQVGSPLIAFILWSLPTYFNSHNVLINTMIANVIGAAIFYNIDKKIFKQGE